MKGRLLDVTRKGRGFSLLELLITVGVVSLGLLGLVSVLAYGVKASRSSEMSSLAMGHSIHLIELIRSRNLGFSSGAVPPSGYSGLNDLPHERRALDAWPFQSDFEADSAFQRCLSIRRVGDDAEEYDHEVLLIRAEVFWSENNEERSVSFEALHTRP